MAEAQPRLRRRDKRTANRARHYAERRKAAERHGPSDVAGAAFDQARALVLAMPVADQERAWVDLTDALDEWRHRHAR